MKKITFYLCLLCLSYSSLAQDIELTNPSFEDKPHIGYQGGRSVKAWMDCGPKDETAIDIHPSPDKSKPFFGVTQVAIHGETFMGMVARDNDTYESVGQRLRQPMKAGSTYQFKIHLATSKEYKSVSRKTNQPADYTTPIILRMWGGDAACGKRQLLGETDAIDHFEWIDYIFTFEPVSDWDYIILEAFWKTPVMFTSNGNILLDHCSKIFELDKMQVAALDKGVVGKPLAESSKTREVLTEGIPTEGRPAKDSNRSTKVNTSKNTETLKIRTALDTAALSSAFVKSNLNICDEKKINSDENGYRLMKLEFLKRVFEIEELSRQSGIKTYISNHSMEEIGLAIRSMKKIGANTMAIFIRELKRVCDKEEANEPLSASQIDLSNNAESLFKVYTKEENISALIDQYIQENDKAIRLELGYCHQ